jgi:hypothetical protein
MQKTVEEEEPKGGPKRDTPYIGPIHEAPQYTLADCVVTGYRINYNDSYAALRSLFTLHNETVNIWSHLLGALLFFALLICLDLSPVTLVTPPSDWCSLLNSTDGGNCSGLDG